MSSIRYTRGGGQISQDSIFTFPKVAESSLNLRLALRQKKKQLRTKDLWFYISLLMIITKGNNDLLRFENQLRHLLPPVDAHCPGPPSHNHSIDICWKPRRQTMIFQHDLQQLHKIIDEGPSREKTQNRESKKNQKGNKWSEVECLLTRFYCCWHALMRRLTPPSPVPEPFNWSLFSKPIQLVPRQLWQNSGRKEVI